VLSPLPPRIPFREVAGFSRPLAIPVNESRGVGKSSIGWLTKYGVAVEELALEKSAEKRSRQDALQQLSLLAYRFLIPKVPLLSEILSSSTATPIFINHRIKSRE